MLILDNIEIASYADDNILYCSYSGFEEVISCLERTRNTPEMSPSEHKKKLKANISNYIITNGNKGKLLGVTIDKQPTKI